MTLPYFDYQAPKSLEEAIALRQEFGDDAMLMAGGLTTVILLRERLISPRVIVSLSDIPKLHGINATGALKIGAMNSYNTIANSEMVRDIVPLLSQACGHIGSPAIRNMGTLGGNVSQGDSASDLAPALLALDAEAIVNGPNGERRIPLKDFFYGIFSTALEEDEILTALYIPRPRSGTRTRFKKYTCRSEEAFATVSVAVTVVSDEGGVCSDVRIGLGSVGPIPMRATAAEDLLRGKLITPELIAQVASIAAAATDPSSDGQATAEYRRAMAGVWVRRLLEDLFPGLNRL